MKVLLTCGGGDFMALESWLHPQECMAVTHIYWATRARRLVEKLAKVAFPNLKQETIIFDKWGEPGSDEFCVESKEQLQKVTKIDLSDVQDWSISQFTRDGLEGRRQYFGSSFSKRTLADTSWLRDTLSISDRFNLKKPYFVIHLESLNAPTPLRDISPKELVRVAYWLDRHDQKAIILGTGEPRIEMSSNSFHQFAKKQDVRLKLSQSKDSLRCFQDLTGKTDIFEALEIARNACGFFGSSSIFSVMCSKVCPAHRMFVKGHSTLRERFAWFYYAPLVGREIVYDKLPNHYPWHGRPRG